MKSKIYEELLKIAQHNVDQAKENYESSKVLVTEGDLKSDGKYDTRAIEAGQLAGAQKLRIEELEEDLHLIESMDLTYTAEVTIGSLILLEFKGKNQWYFVCSALGGTILTMEGHHILVVTAFSPIGQEIIGLQKGDSFEIESPKENREYYIIDVR